MASYNKVMLMGNITRDLELRYTPNGAAVCDMSLAINSKFGGEGQQREETTFVDVVVWSKQAENCSRFLKKGSPCFVEGRLQLDTWDDRETGKKRSRLRVVAERVQFLGRADQNSNQNDQQQYGSAPKAPQQGFGGAPAPQQYAPPAPQPSQNAFAPQQAQPAPAPQQYAPQQAQQAPAPTYQQANNTPQPQVNQPAAAPVKPQGMPPMPDNAFSAGSVEDDIPF